MTTLSDKAFAIMAVCEETKRPFGITVGQRNNLRDFIFKHII